MKFLCIIMTIMIAGVAPRVLAQRLIVTNPLDVDRPPQVVDLHDAGDLLAAVLDDHHRRDLALLHDVQRFDRKRRAGDGPAAFRAKVSRLFR